MSMDAMQQITESEERARESRAAAQAQAQARTDQAVKDGQAGLAEARNAAQAQVRALLAQAETQGAEHSRAVLQQFAKDCQALKDKAGKRLDKAAEWIAEQVGQS